MTIPIPQKELDFMASFARFSIQKDTKSVQSILEIQPYHTSFHLFGALLPEIRHEIWALTLPSHRVLKITSRSTVSPTHIIPPSDYVVSPISYGGAHPIALSICRESRAEALRKLTLKFNAYWDLRSDVAYLEVHILLHGKEMKQISDMHTQGLWDDITKMAIDIDVLAGEDCSPLIALLRTSHQMKSLDFIFRYRKPLTSEDVLDPGTSWYLIDADSEEQTEFKTHKDWCNVIMAYQNKLADIAGKDVVDHEDEWMARPTQPVFSFGIIEGRKTRHRGPVGIRE